MTDDTSSRGRQDRTRISADEPYEAAYFVKKHRISEEQSEKTMAEYGARRKGADKAPAE